MISLTVLCLTVLAYAVTSVQSSSITNSKGLSLEIDQSTGNYRLLVGGTAWLSSAPTFFTVKGKRYSNEVGGGLKLVKVEFNQGRDELGRWNATAFVYNPVDAPGIDLVAAFKQYHYLPDIILFGQVYPDDVEGTSNGNRNNVCTGFPSFWVENPKQKDSDREMMLKSADKEPKYRLNDYLRKMYHSYPRRGLGPFFKNNEKHEMNKGAEEINEKAVDREQLDLGYLAWGGIMFGDIGKSVGRWTNTGVKAIHSGLDSGPLVLFPKSGDDALVLSPFSEFMTASAVYAETKPGQMSVSWGLMGTITRIPGHFHLWTIASYSNKGINKAISTWGEVLRTYYRRGTEFRDSDMTNNYIGYYTDNGAYYYYKTEPGLNYEDTIIAEIKYAQKNNIPYRYVQYDSWFYSKGSDQGVKQWKAMPSIFPRGMEYVWNNTGLTVVAHNRWWSYQTIYAKDNGGKYDFIVENTTKKALPIDQQFWDDLMAESRKWGLTVYEQDWLNDQFDMMNATVSDISLGRKWLLQMGKGASKNGLTIQYCMSPSRHALQTLEIPVVSQVRVSTDYQPGNDQWKIGITSMFAHAMGVAPFKDNFWTISDQPGNPYKKSEPYPELGALVATLSTGPVGPADRIGYTNRELIMRSCNSDGLILKPAKPATAINLQLKKTAFEGFTCEVWSTSSNISGLIFGAIFAADCKHDEQITLTPNEAGFGPYLAPSVVYSWFNSTQSVPFDRFSSLTLKGCTRKPFCYYLTSPIIVDLQSRQKIVLYGELSKWVPVSPKRVTGIHLSFDDIYVTLQGGSGEAVDFTYSINGVLSHTKCILSSDGTGTLQILNGKCRF